MAIEQSTLFNIGILLFGGVLLFLLGFVFYQLAFQKVPEWTGSPSPTTGVGKRVEKANTQKYEPPAIAKNTGSRHVPVGPSKSKAVLPSITQSARMPDLASLGIKETKLPVSGPATANNNEAGSLRTNINSTMAAESILAAKAEQMEPLPGIQKEKDVINALGTFSGQSGDITSVSGDGEKLPEAPEIAPPVPATLPPLPESAPPVEKSKEEKSGSLMDMFAEEEAEETESNKVAKNLEQVDIHDLLEESQNLINSFTRRGS